MATSQAASSASTRPRAARISSSRSPGGAPEPSPAKSPGVPIPASILDEWQAYLPYLPRLKAGGQTAGRAVTNIRLAPPSLETLFVSLTGRKLG